MNTGLYDKNGTPINIGDKTRLVLKDGEVRVFDVRFKTVKRTTIKTLRGFEPESVDVTITGIFFCWEGNDLLPCVDENGVSDVEKMEVMKEPRIGDFVTSIDGHAGIVTAVKDSYYGRMIFVVEADGRVYHFPLADLKAPDD